VPDAVVVATARTPIGRAFKGSLKDERPDEMATQVVSSLLASVPGLDPQDIEDLMLGCGSPGGQQGFNMARVVSVLLGLDHLPGTTVNRYCSSSVQTTRMAFHAIKAGEGDVFISAGVESCSSYVYGEADSIPDTMNPQFDDARARSEASAASNDSWTDPRLAGLIPDVYIEMGQTAENVALQRGVTREAMDEYALLTQQRAARALENGFWSRDITPYTRKDGTVLDADDAPRPETTAEGLAGLRPAFREDGRVTAGNACPLSDGASAVLVMSGAKARDLGLTPLARIISTGVSGLSPEVMGMGPVEASRRAMSRAKLAMKDIDLVEINEAFAAQVLPSAEDLSVPIDKLNVNGGAIAVGHPFGSTGGRITSTLINGLRERDGEIGLVTMCVGGGQGMALILERLS